MPWPKTGTNHYLAKLGLLENGRAIKGLVVLVLRNFNGLKPKIFQTRTIMSTCWKAET